MLKQIIEILLDVTRIVMFQNHHHASNLGPETHQDNTTKTRNYLQEKKTIGKSNTPVKATLNNNQLFATSHDFQAKIRLFVCNRMTAY